MITLLVLIGVAFFTWLFCILLLNPESKLYVVDDPNNRSLHDVPKPRTGGIAIVTSIFLSWLIIAVTSDVGFFIFYLLIGLLVLASISYIDDRNSIPQLWRLLMHFVAAYFIVSSGLSLSADYFVNQNGDEYKFVLDILTILIIVWCINLYNFMDGIDGLAGGMGVIGFGCIAVLGLIAGEFYFTFLACVIVAANIGFLAHNFPPAKLFMGDVGSITMGYLLAFFSLWGIQINVFHWWIPLLVFSPFIVDTTITLVRRLFSGKKIWEAHKSHYYQILVQIGWGHKKTDMHEYILMGLVAISAIIMQVFDSRLFSIVMLLSWILVYTAIIFIIGRLKYQAGKTS